MCVALLHLLPESTEIFNEYMEEDGGGAGDVGGNVHKHEKQFPVSFVLAFCGYTLILMIEKIIFDAHTHQMPELEEEEVNVEEAENAINPNPKSPKNNPKLFQPDPTSTSPLMKISSGYIPAALKRNSSNRLQEFNLPTISNKNINTFNLSPKTNNKNTLPPLTIQDQYEYMSRMGNTIMSSKKGSFSISTMSKAKRDKINNYLDTFKNNTVEKKEENFKNLFTTTGRISSMLLVNDSLRKRTSAVMNNSLQEELLSSMRNKEKDTINEKEKIQSEISPKEEDIHSGDSISSYLLLLALSIHACFEGIAIGLQGSTSEIFYMFLAISCHKWVEALSIGINLGNSKIERSYLLKYIILFSSMTPLGICFGIFFSGFSELVEGVFLAISAGSFIYISSSEIVIEEFSVSRFKKEKFVGFLTGAAMVCCLTLFEHHH